MTNDFNIKDISQINMNKTFFHYTNKNNLNNIIKNTQKLINLSKTEIDSNAR